MAILFDRYDITFAEVPDEVSLTFSITNCQGRCEGCHSPHLRENKGTDLLQVLPELLEKYKGMITCVCFLGEGNDEKALLEAVGIIKKADLKVCLYSGRDSVGLYTSALIELCNYVKVGSYKKDFGGLNSPTTNQRMWKKVRTQYGSSFWSPYHWEDITPRFWTNDLLQQ